MRPITPLVRARPGTPSPSTHPPPPSNPGTAPIVHPPFRRVGIVTDDILWSIGRLILTRTACLSLSLKEAPASIYRRLLKFQGDGWLDKPTRLIIRLSHGFVSETARLSAGDMWLTDQDPENQGLFSKLFGSIITDHSPLHNQKYIYLEMRDQKKRPNTTPMWLRISSPNLDKFLGNFRTKQNMLQIFFLWANVFFEGPPLLIVYFLFMKI